MIKVLFTKQPDTHRLYTAPLQTEDHLPREEVYMTDRFTEYGLLLPDRPVSLTTATGLEKISAEALKTLRLETILLELTKEDKVFHIQLQPLLPDGDILENNLTGRHTVRFLSTTHGATGKCWKSVSDKPAILHLEYKVEVCPEEVTANLTLTRKEMAGWTVKALGYVCSVFREDAIPSVPTAQDVISYGNVLAITVKDGLCVLEEQCDRYYSTELNKAGTEQLIAKLTAILPLLNEAGPDVNEDAHLG